MAHAIFSAVVGAGGGQRNAAHFHHEPLEEAPPVDLRNPCRAHGKGQWRKVFTSILGRNRCNQVATYIGPYCSRYYE